MATRTLQDKQGAGLRSRPTTYSRQGTRMTFLKVTACLLPLATMATVLPATAAETQQVNMLLVTPDATAYASHTNGAVLGQTEGNIQGRFLGIDYQLQTQNPGAALHAQEGISAVIVAAPLADLLQVYQVYTAQQVPVFNIATEDDSLRALCRPGLYHTLPSRSMLMDAAAQWKQANPDSNVQAVAWHPEFVKFAGRDLNKRYTEQFDVAMDSAAWAGWAATRIVAEAVVRTGSTDAEDIDAYLRTGLGFDGQKGVAQTFRDNGQLRQPLLLVNNAGELVGEAPVRGVADSNDLDSLGLPGCL